MRFIKIKKTEIKSHLLLFAFHQNIMQAPTEIKSRPLERRVWLLAAKIDTSGNFAPDLIG